MLFLDLTILYCNCIFVFQIYFFKNTEFFGFVIANNCVRQTVPLKHPFFLWHTWVSLRSVYLAGALGLH